MLDEFDELRFRDVLLFDSVVRLGTITAAARELDVPKPTAARWLAAMEIRAGGPLLVRGARKVTLTQRGHALHGELQTLLRGIRAARLAVRDDRPGGTLRVSVPVPLGRLVGGSVIAGVRAEMPGVRLEVLLQDERVDLRRDRIDLAIRGGPLPDSTLLARRLATVPMWLYAGARWTGADPSTIPLIAAARDERMLRGRHPELLPAVVVVHDRTAIRDALLQGVGAGVLPAFLGEPARHAGELIRLDEQELSTIDVHAVYLPEQRRDLRIRALVELIEVEMKAWMVVAG